MKDIKEISISKLKNTNFLNLRLFFIVFFFFEILVFSYFNETSSYADLIWHIKSGQKILSGNLNFDHFIYSPIFSIISNLTYNNADNLVFRSISELLKLILIFITSFLLLLIIDFKKISNFKEITLNDLFPLLFLIFNPYIVKYSSPPYSDTYALIAGLIFALRYSYTHLSQNIKDQINPFFKYITGKRYYLVIIFLSLIRYPVIIILFTSLISDLYLNISKKFNKFFNRFLKYLFLIGMTIFIFHLSNMHIEKLNLNTNNILLIITFITSTLGFRESLATDLTNPFNLINPDRILELFLSKKIFISQLELQLTILVGIILFFISVIGIFRIFYFKSVLKSSFLIASLLLISSELIIGYAHYRYFLLLLPSIIIGFSLKKQSLKN